MGKGSRQSPVKDKIKGEPRIDTDNLLQKTKSNLGLRGGRG